MKYRKGIFVVVYKFNKEKIEYLILKRKLHWKGWEFVKGGVEEKEMIIHAVKREVKEETGLIVKEIKKHDYSGKYKYDKLLVDREGIEEQNFKLFSAHVKLGRKIKIDAKEHSHYKWVDFKEALGKLTWSNQRKSLRIVNKSLIGTQKFKYF